jgi:hypothetical protein
MQGERLRLHRTLTDNTVCRNAKALARQGIVRVTIVRSMIISIRQPEADGKEAK